MSDALTLVDSLDTGPRELAMLASLARRVEPQLLRALRLELAEGRSVADEADLWFSPIVESSSATGLVFMPEALAVLQRRLADDPLRRLDSVWHLMFRMRATIPFPERERAQWSTWLIVQEELTYWAVRGGPSNEADEARIDMLFAWVQKNFADEQTSRDAALWLRSAHLRLPAKAWTLPGATRVSAAAGKLRRGRLLRVRRVEEGIELIEQQDAEGHLIRTAAPPGPIRVDVVPYGDFSADPRTVFVDDELSFVPVTMPSVDLRLADGQSFALDVALPKDSGLAEASATLNSLVSIRSNGTSWTGLRFSSRFVLTCASPLGKGDISVSALGRGPDAPAKRISARVHARSPFDAMGPLPPPFSSEADDLAILRLQEPMEGHDLLGKAIVEPTQPVLGREVTIHALTHLLDDTRSITGVVASIDETGYRINLSGAIRSLIDLQGATGAPVSLDTGELLGLLVRSLGGRERRTVFVAPMRPLRRMIGEIRQNVLVVGTGEARLPEPAARAAVSIGQALARAGHTLVCGGWPGVDHVVAKSFIAARGFAGRPDEKRIVQLVEQGWTPSFAADVEPVEIDPVNWIPPMIARADVIVAIGGLGGVSALCEAAWRAGLPVLPIPATGDDAAWLYVSLLDGSRRQVFPDRRALHVLEGGIETVQRAESRAASVIELIRDCMDEVRVNGYRQSAAALCGLLVRNDTKVTGDDRSELHKSGYIDELFEARGGRTLPPTFELAAKALRDTLPVAADWLARDLLKLEDAPDSDNLRRAWGTLLETVLTDKHAAAQLRRELLSGTVRTWDIDSLHRKWWNRALQFERQLSSLVDEFFKSLDAERESGRAFARLLERAHVLLDPDNARDFNKARRQLNKEVSDNAASIDIDRARMLLTSPDPVLRGLGYIYFRLSRVRPPEMLSLLVDAIGRESSEARSSGDLRYVALLFGAIGAAVDDSALARLMPPDVGSRMKTLLDAVMSIKNVVLDPHLTDILGSVINTLKVRDTTERFASYSRRINASNGQNDYEWCLFVDAPMSRLRNIEKIEYTLDASFERPERIIADASQCFALHSSSNSGLTVQIRVFRPSGQTVEQSFQLDPKPDSWPLGPVFLGRRDEPSAIVYALLEDARWEWRTESALFRGSGMDRSQLDAVLEGLDRAGYVRKAYFRSASNEPLWGATSRVGFLPAPIQ